MSDNTKTPAAVGAATDVSTNLNVDRRNDSLYSYDTTEVAFCQAIIREIDESAREIYDNTTDNESAAYNAGKIQGLVYALTLIRGIKNDN